MSDCSKLPRHEYLPATASARLPLGKQMFKSDWSVDTVQIDLDCVTITGWYCTNVGTPVDVLINGVKASAEYYDRGDLTPVFTFLLPERKVLAFTARAKVPAADEYEFELSVPAATISTFYYPVDQASEYPIPPSSRIERVNGFTDVSTFKRSGYTHYKIISALLEKFSKRKDVLRVLDWGCGCGSVGRYFLSAPQFSYSGCDIDQDNLMWCRRNLLGGLFYRVPLSAPAVALTPSPFDCIFGISVISHLSHSNIVAWSKWLALNLAPGGILLLTTLGLQAAAKTDEDTIEHILKAGVWFSEDRQHPIGEIIGDPGFYGTSFQTPNYLSEAFREDFDVVDHRQGGLGHQDIAILQRR